MIFPFNNCDVWFVRFDLDFSYNKFAVGSLIGEVFVWDLEECLSNPGSEPRHAYIKHPNCNCIIRKVSFRYDSKSARQPIVTCGLWFSARQKGILQEFISMDVIYIQIKIKIKSILF